MMMLRLCEATQEPAQAEEIARTTRGGRVEERSMIGNVTQNYSNHQMEASDSAPCGNDLRWLTARALILTRYSLRSWIEDNRIDDPTIHVTIDTYERIVS